VCHWTRSSRDALAPKRCSPCHCRSNRRSVSLPRRRTQGGQPTTVPFRSQRRATPSRVGEPKNSTRPGARHKPTAPRTRFNRQGRCHRRKGNPIGAGRALCRFGSLRGKLPATGSRSNCEGHLDITVGPVRQDRGAVPRIFRQPGGAGCSAWSPVKRPHLRRRSPQDSYELAQAN